jgi:predicted nucleic acid-binding protein
VTRFVLDASVALAWVVDRNPDPYAAIVQQRLQAGERVIVPTLWQLEVTNVLTMVHRRGVLSAVEVEEGLLYFESFLAAQAEIISVYPGMREVLRLAGELGLTSYDALYVDLARREGLSLATLDKSLRSAAAKAGVAFLK